MISALTRLLLTKVNNGFGYFYGYDLAKGKPIEPIYCEITGYGLSLHSFLSILSDSKHRDLVRGLSKFLVSACSRSSALVLPYGFYVSKNQWSSLVYSFDNGVIAKGFFDAYRVLSDAVLLERGLGICEWLVSVMQSDNGAFRAAYNYEKGVFTDFDEWYGDNGCLHGKLAIPLLVGWRLSGDSRFRESVEKLLSWLLRLQLADGGFRAKEGADYVFHHAHCYALEGLLYAWHVLRDDRYLNAVVRGAEWLARVQFRNGGIPDFYPSSFVRRLATDATAQAVRIWLALYKILCEDKWLKLAERGLGFLGSAVFRGGRWRGALPAYVYSLGPLRRAVPRVHTWSMMFAIQAFTMYENLGKLSPSDIIEYLF